MYIQIHMTNHSFRKTRQGNTERQSNTTKQSFYSKNWLPRVGFRTHNTCILSNTLTNYVCTIFTRYIIIMYIEKYMYIHVHIHAHCILYLFALIEIPSKYFESLHHYETSNNCISGGYGRNYIACHGCKDTSSSFIHTLLIVSTYILYRICSFSECQTHGLLGWQLLLQNPSTLYHPGKNEHLTMWRINWQEHTLSHTNSPFCLYTSLNWDRL